jgi:rfaE bifunctional protein kinase chain/domain
MSAPAASDVVAEIKSRAAHARRIVFVSGNFNVVHPGHSRLLKFAADCGDFLVVGVNPDRAAPGAIVPQDLRLEGVRSIGFVDFAFVLQEPAEAFIARLKPSVVVKGKEHENGANPERTVVASYGGKLLFSSGDVVFSSVDLLKKEFVETNLSSIVKPRDFPPRHRFDMRGLLATVSRFPSLRVTVVGDLIVDEYVNCDPLGMSQEDPTIVVTPIQRNRFVGGAGIVAAHAKGLGAEVRFFSVAGNDAECGFARSQLESVGVRQEILEDESRPTTLKQRYRAAGKTLLRVSHLKQHAVNRELSGRLADAVARALQHTDLLIFSDFNYGCLPQPVVNHVVGAAAQRGVMMVADSQSSSQVGDVSRFKGMALLTPTEREARLALRDFEVGLVVLAERLRSQSLAKNLIITLGAEGILIHAPHVDQSEWVTDRLPALNLAPKDPAGAGDSLLCCSSMALAVGADIWQGAYLGSLAAACQAGRVGNLPLSAKELTAEIAAP